jgi:hypothetical protein
MRFPVLLVSLGFLVYCLAMAGKRAPVAPLDRVFGGLFVSVIDLQVLLGIGLAATGHAAHASMGINLHMGVMLIVVALAHVASVLNRRRTAERPWRAVVPAALVLALVVTGILLTGKGLMGGAIS